VRDIRGTRKCVGVLLGSKSGRVVIRKEEREEGNLTSCPKESKTGHKSRDLMLNVFF